ALHHLVGDAAPQHRPALVHEAGEEGVRLVVRDSLLVVDAAVQGDVDAEGQESHAAGLTLLLMERQDVAEQLAENSRQPSRADDRIETLSGLRAPLEAPLAPDEPFVVPLNQLRLLQPAPQ